MHLTPLIETIRMLEFDELVIEKKPESAVHTPHDSAFKIAFNELRVAHDFIVRCVPKDVLDRADLKTLRRCSENFVDRALHKTEADVIYCAKIRNRNPSSEEQYVYFLIEQQRNPDRWSPLRVFSYNFGIMNAHRREHPKARCLPLVFSMVLYNGRKPYPYSEFFSDLFGDQKDLATRFLFGSIHFILVDLARTSNGQLKTHGWPGLVEFVLKNAGSMDPFDLLKEAWLPLIKPLPEDSDYTAGMVKYVLSQSDIEDVPAFLEKVRVLFSPSIEEKVMGFVEYFTQKGVEQGMQQGMQQGEQRGEQRGLHRGQRKLFLVLLKKTNDAQKAAELLDLTPEEVRDFLEDQAAE